MESPQSVAAAPMQAALREQVVRLESTLAGGGLIMSVAGIALSLYTALRIAPDIGWPLVVMALGLCAYFSTVQWVLRRGWLTRAVPWVAPVVEVTIPSILVWLDVQKQGAEYALESSGPLQFYSVFTALGVLRMRPWLPLGTAAVAALQYVALLALWIIPRASEELLARPALRPDMLVMRGVVIVLGGGVCSAVAWALRRAVNGANAEVRSQDLFGKYQLEKELAQGGMGVVFKATYCPEGGFRRSVAVKRIHPHLAVMPHLVGAFRQEAELCARLLHPNIVQVLDFGRVGDTYFLAMEFVDGCTLLELMMRAQPHLGCLPPAVVAYVGVEMCRALDFAHHGATDDNGKPLRVLHRDINPPNIMVSRTGQVKVTDFGVAKALGEQAATHTQSGAGKGGYMAPEQITGAPVDVRADLFAAGVVLWEAMCLRHLFQREGHAQSVHAVMTVEPEAVSQLLPGLPDAAQWDAFFRRALHRDVESRFSTAQEMLVALEELARKAGVMNAQAMEEFVTSLPPLEGGVDAAPTTLSRHG